MGGGDEQAGNQTAVTWHDACGRPRGTDGPTLHRELFRVQVSVGCRSVLNDHIVACVNEAPVRNDVGLVATSVDPECLST
jgi:hypothetical protein